MRGLTVLALVAVAVAAAAASAVKNDNADPRMMRWTNAEIDAKRAENFERVMSGLVHQERVSVGVPTIRSRAEVSGEVTLRLSAYGSEFKIDLHRNDYLLSAGWEIDGEKYAVSPEENCFYIGTATEVSSSDDAARSGIAAFSFCHERVEGTWTAGGDTYELISHEQNMRKRDPSLPTHIVYRMSDLDEEIARACVPHAASALAKSYAARSSDDLADLSGLSAKGVEARNTDRYILMHLYGDAAFTLRWGTSVGLQRLYMIANGAAAIYENGNTGTTVFNPKLHFASVKVAMWTLNPFTASKDADVYIDNLAWWFSTQPDVTQVAVHIITGLDLHVDGEYAVTGYAPIASTCTLGVRPALFFLCNTDVFSQYIGLAEDSPYSLAFTSATLAHEVGHNLNAIHDSAPGAANCAASGFVMAAISYQRETLEQWSSCSISRMNAYMTSTNVRSAVPYARRC